MEFVKEEDFKLGSSIKIKKVHRDSAVLSGEKIGAKIAQNSKDVI